MTCVALQEEDEAEPAYVCYYLRDEEMLVAEEEDRLFEEVDLETYLDDEDYFLEPGEEKELMKGDTEALPPRPEYFAQREDYIEKSRDCK